MCSPYYAATGRPTFGKADLKNYETCHALLPAVAHVVFVRPMSIRHLVLSLSFGISALAIVAAQQERICSPFGEKYPAQSGNFSRDEERAIAVASAKLSGRQSEATRRLFQGNPQGKRSLGL